MRSMNSIKVTASGNAGCDFIKKMDTDILHVKIL